MGAPDKWIEGLVEILDNFIDTYQGKVNLEFWNSGLYAKLVMGYAVGSGVSCQDAFDGWIKKFFIYDFDKKCTNLQYEKLYSDFKLHIKF